MSRLLLTMAILLQGILQCLAAGSDFNNAWQNGNRCYSEKKYDSAALYYEQIAAAKPSNAVLYFNLGNTYYRLNRIGPAVLNYERALRIDPSFKEAQENLTLTQSRISNFIHPRSDIFFIRWWESLTRAENATTWSCLALISFALLMAVLFFRRFSRSYGSRIPVQVTGMLVFVFICLLAVAFIASRRNVETTSAVVMQNDAPLMGAGLNGKPLVLVPEGTVVKLKDSNAGWIEVSLPDGRTGWLRKDVLSEI